jgi:transaldolase
MRLYLDTADRAAAESLLATGLFAGVTTNPTILQRAGVGVADIPDIYRWATAAGAREVFFQAWGEDTATLVQRGRDQLDHSSWSRPAQAPPPARHCPATASRRC